MKDISCIDMVYDYSKFVDRLSTFNDRGWPPDSPVFIKDLVEAGFSYTGSADLVFCFRCGETADNWKEGEEPLQRHEFVNKHCPFLKDRLINVSGETVASTENYGDSVIYEWINGQVIRRAGESTGDLKNRVINRSPEKVLNTSNRRASANGVNAPCDYSKFVARLNTFNYKGWPPDNPVFIKDLAEAGFSYTGEGDVVFCFQCGVTANDWQEGEEPLNRHKLLNEHCPFLKNRLLNVSGEPATSSGNHKSSSNFEYVNGRTVRTAAHMNGDVNKELNRAPEIEIHNVNQYPNAHGVGDESMRYEINRLRSFALCPINKDWPSVELLAKNGFYWLHRKQTMLCFCCNLKVDDWDSPDQNVTQHHQNSSRSCGFARGLPSGNIEMGGESEVTVGMSDLKIQEEDPSLLRSVSPSPVSSPPVQYAQLAPPSFANRQISEPYGYSYTGMHSGGLPIYQMHQEGQESHQSYPSQYVRSSSFPPISNAASMNHNANRSQPDNTDNHKCIPIDLSSKLNRLKTFLTWPKDAPVQPVELTEAGFYYTSRADCVKCYKCDILLGKWSPGDSAWEEHKRYSPTCPLVLEKMKQKFPGTLHGLKAVDQYLQQSPPSYQGEYSYYTEHLNQSNGVLMGGNPYVNDNNSRQVNGFQKRSLSTVDPYVDVNNTIQYPNSFPKRSFSTVSQRDVYHTMGNYTANRFVSPQHMGNADPRITGHQFEANHNYLNEAGTQETRNYVNELGPIESRIYPNQTAPVERRNINRIDENESSKITKDDDKKLCTICLDAPVEVSFRPCGHLVVCVACSNGLKSCPICREEVKEVLRTYFYGN